MLKSLLKRSLNAAVRRDALWSLMNRTFIPFADYCKYLRAMNDIGNRMPEVDAAVRKFSPELVVKHGPFRGMQYPEMKSVGSALISKILGCYEQELHPLIERICANDYTEIVDVGCAEGYYAVGLAMRIPTARVYVYDTQSEAVALCRQMAEKNGVADRLVTGGFCSPDTLAAIPFTKRALIVCDCEGYEKELFTPAVVPHLAGHDLLIEIHDFIDIEISSAIRQRFAATHSIESIASIDDITKAHTYEYEELAGYDLKGRKFLLGEGRPAIMEWLYLTPLAK